MQQEVVSTAGVKPKDRLAYWNENACQKVAPVRTHQFGGERFHAAMQSKLLRNFTLMRIHSSSCFVETEAAQFEQGMLNMVLVRRGEVSCETKGIEATLDPHDMILLDPDHRMKVTFPTAMEILILRLPHVALEQHLPAFPRLTGQKLQGSAKGAAIFSKFLANVWDLAAEDDGDGWLDAVDSTLWPILKLAYTPHLSEIAKELDPGVIRRNGLLAIIEKRLCDPDLSTEVLASSAGMTARNVQLIFAQMGVTPMTYIRHRRLDLAAQHLAMDANANITHVCFDVGFGDLSTFCRCFRTRFGVAPSQYRIGMRAPLPGRPA